MPLIKIMSVDKTPFEKFEEIVAELRNGFAT